MLKLNKGKVFCFLNNYNKETSYYQVISEANFDISENNRNNLIVEYTLLELKSKKLYKLICEKTFDEIVNSGKELEFSNNEIKKIYLIEEDIENILNGKIKQYVSNLNNIDIQFENLEKKIETEMIEPEGIEDGVIQKIKEKEEKIIIEKIPESEIKKIENENEFVSIDDFFEDPEEDLSF